MTGLFVKNELCNGGWVYIIFCTSILDVLSVSVPLCACLATGTVSVGPTVRVTRSMACSWKGAEDTGSCKYSKFFCNQLDNGKCYLPDC